MMSFLTTPVLYTIIATLTTGLASFTLKACNDHSKYTELNTKYTNTLEELNNCKTNLKIIESTIQQQADQLSKYKASQERYRVQSISKYEAIHEKEPQPCSFDFTFANELLATQGTQRIPHH